MKNKIESIDYTCEKCKHWVDDTGCDILSGMICYPDKEKPTYKGFEPKDESKIQMTEEQFDEFYRDCIPEMFYNVVKINAKSKGYIIKSPVEEAEEYIRHVEEIMDGLIAPSPKDLEYSVRIVEKLKSEIERLKN
jgi:hypothetical protein